METLDKLAQTLDRISRVALSSLRASDMLPIQGERLKLLAWLGNEVAPEEASGDRILTALHHFSEAGYVRDLRQARLLCYGCTMAYSERADRLLENQKLFECLLQYLTQHAQTRVFRKCFRGLMNAYFSYDPDAPAVRGTGRSNWGILRDYLQRHQPILATAGHLPEWINVLASHPELLQDDPCAVFHEAGNGIDRFEAVRVALNIGTDSWLVRNFVSSQFERILHLSDKKFRARVDEALLLLHQFPFYISPLLGQLLDRYSRCAPRPPSDTLRQFAVEQWGAPWLAQNEVNWQCSPAAVGMISGWGKRHLVREFFHLFALTGADNSRRAAFWNLYSEDLQGMYFALGSDAFDIQNRAFLQFRSEAKGLVVKLNDSKHNLHAVILQFPSHHVVEFSQQMNVAYFYDTRLGTPQFYLSKGWVDVGALSVGKAVKGNSKSASAKPLAHSDETLMTWEGRFAQELGGSDMARIHFCEHHQAQYQLDDGQAWIKPNNKERYPAQTASVLLGWGYTWSPEVQGYFRKLPA